jgi:glycosyltransferase involved in cell wall biosynthesis
MHNGKTISFCIAYESCCSGETAATEAIIKEFTKFSYATVLSCASSPLRHTDFFRFFYWVISSMVRWIFVLYSNRHVDWVYTTTFTAGVAAVLIKPFSSYNLAWHFHGSRIPPSPTGLQGKTYVTQVIKHWVVQKLHIYFLKRTDIVFVPTDKAKQWLLDAIPTIDRSKIHIVPNGVDQKRFHPISKINRLVLRKKYGIDNDSHVLLSVGRPEKQKGLETLFSVVKDLFQTDKNIRLFLVSPRVINDGERRFKRYLNQLIESYTLKKVIAWAEEPAHIEDYYHMADLTVSLSRLEFFSLTMLESLACGTPFLGFSSGNIESFLSFIDKRLVIKDRSVSKISRQIKAILSLPLRERKIIQQKGCRYSLTYTWNHSAQMLLEHLIHFQRYCDF